ncbi:MAG: Cd(II)/Pb(II)-responsive transcriptional regulator [Proteobacteria bacterium]|nr:Cd(II)/Pb(II)-responsive transcriptional regulator [Pseudomonadota bacterium]
MQIGELAHAAGTPVDTIRYYERQGLLPAPARTASNYRVYEAAHLERLLFIRHCRNLDLSLDEVRALLAVRDAPGSDCHAADRVLDAHIGHVSQRIRELQQLARELKALRAQCASSQQAEACGVLSGLSVAASQGGGRVGAKASHVGAVHKEVAR